jgi:hypothetical protein
MSDLTITVTPEEVATLRAYHAGEEVTLGKLRPLLDRLAEEASRIREEPPARSLVGYERRLHKASVLTLVAEASRINLDLDIDTAMRIGKAEVIKRILEAQGLNDDLLKGES